jgi:hypothetical protein
MFSSSIIPFGIDPDEAGPDPCGEPMQIAGRPGRAARPERPGDDRRGPVEEGTRAADLHFNQQRLAFVQYHAARPTDRLTPPFARQTALVHGMTGFVQHAHQGL